MLASQAGERLWDYWKRQLAGPLPVLNLPTDRPRPPIQTSRGAQHDFTVSGEMARRLRALAQSRGRDAVHGVAGGVQPDAARP